MLPRPLLHLAIAALFALPYLRGDGPWRYGVADLAILAVAAVALGRDAPAALGLRVPPRQLVPAALVGLGAAALAFAFLRSALPGPRLAVELHLEPRWLLFSLSQVLHQEMVLRGWVLGGIRRRVRSDLAASLPVALAFVAVHAAFFAWRDGVGLPAPALATLLAFALVGNHLYLAFGHVAFALALHAGWNAVRFNAAYVALPGGRLLGEGETFSVVEGHPLALAGALVLLAGCAAARWARDPAARAGARRVLRGVGLH